MYVACPSAVLGPGEQNQYAAADAERAALEGVSLAWGPRGRDEHSSAACGCSGEGSLGCCVCSGTCHLTRTEREKSESFSDYLMMESGMETI